MMAATSPASVDTPVAAQAVEQQAPDVAVSLVTLPSVRATIDARGLSLGILAALASLFALSWAQNFVVPVLLGIVIAYTLNPLVSWLEEIKVPRIAGTVIVMASVFGLVALGTYSLRG